MPFIYRRDVLPPACRQAG